MFVRKPKQWDSMSAEDKTWFRCLNKGNAFDMLLQAIDEKNELRTEVILSRRDFKTGEERLAALLRAIDAKSSLLCDAILNTYREFSSDCYYRGFDFGEDSDAMAAGIKQALRKAIAFDDATFWQNFYPLCNFEYGIKPDDEVLADMLLEQPISDKLLSAHLEVMKADEVSLFLLMHKSIYKKYPQQTDLVLKYMDKFYSETKQKSFERFAVCGDVSLTRRFLDIWPDLYLGEAFYGALNNKQDQVVGVILPLLDFKKYPESMRALLNDNIEDLDLRTQALKTFDVAHPRVGDEVYARVDDQTLSQTKVLGDGKCLIVLFDFHLGEMMPVGDGGNGSLFPGPSKKFNELGNPDVLEELRQKLIELDGHPDELNISPVRKGALQQKQFNPMTS